MADHDPVTIRDLNNLEKLMLSKFDAIERATKIAADNLGAKLMPRDECTRKQTDCSKDKTEKLEDLMAFKNELKGKASQNSVLFAIVIALIGAAGTLIQLFK